MAAATCRPPSIRARRNGHSTRDSLREPARTRWPAARSSTCRCTRRCAPAACWRSARESRRLLLVPEQKRQLDTFAALAAIALERVHYVEVAQQALLRMESERLRNSLLAALSHDLRTPLAALIGLAESLTLTRPALSGPQLESAQAIADEAHRMSALVNNLLDMARIQSGEVKLRREWQPFEEVVGSALKAAQRCRSARHRVATDLDPDAATGRVRRDADRARTLQPARKCGKIHAGRDADPAGGRRFRR